ncbi:hypothetical protein BS78_04G189100 [Paspalum vaginatum]|nr:hypothetical protein BS78_04G189100 [Paspalum vaginatum]
MFGLLVYGLISIAQRKNRCLVELKRDPGEREPRDADGNLRGRGGGQARPEAHRRPRRGRWSWMRAWRAAGVLDLGRGGPAALEVDLPTVSPRQTNGRTSAISTSTSFGRPRIRLLTGALRSRWPQLRLRPRRLPLCLRSRRPPLPLRLRFAAAFKCVGPNLVAAPGSFALPLRRISTLRSDGSAMEAGPSIGQGKSRDGTGPKKN